MFNKSRHGFRKVYSCETQLATFLHNLHDLDSDIQTDASFLEFAKAFDKAPQKRLLLKPVQLNMNPDIFDWIKEFLNNRSQSALIINHT